MNVHVGTSGWELRPLGRCALCEGDTPGWWADRIREWNDQGREVYAYFNNDGDGNAVRHAETLRLLLH